MNQRMAGGDLSLESPLRDDSDDEQKDFIQSYGLSVEETVANDEIKARLAIVLDKLKKRLNSKEISILSDRLLSDEPLTLQEIADQFGISRERVRQIEANLLQKMAKFFEEEVPDIKTFLDEAVDFWRA
jgi:RNA polymerase sigma-32 factor